MSMTFASFFVFMIMNILLLMCCLGGQHEVEAVQLIFKTKSALWLFDSTTHQILERFAFQGTDYGFDLESTSFDDLTQTYVFGTIDGNKGPAVHFFSLASRTFETTVVKNQCSKLFNPPQLVSVTSYDGTAYFICSTIGWSGFLLGSIDISTKSVTTLYSNTNIIIYQFSQGLPLIYFPGEKPFFYIEVSLFSLADRLMIKINSSLLYLTEMSTGWKELRYFQSCDQVLWGQKDGDLFTIDRMSFNLQTLFRSTDTILSKCPHPSILLTTMAQDVSIGQVFTISVCQQTLNLMAINGVFYQSFDIQGNQKDYFDLSTSSFILNPGDTVIGLQITAVNDTNSQCFLSPPPAELPSLSNFPFLDVIIPICLLLFFFIFLSIFLLSLLIRRRRDYSHVKADDTESLTVRRNNSTLYEALSASGGKIEAQEIQMKELIGQGSFANVYCGFFHETRVAIKVVKMISTKDMEKTLLEEASLMVKLRHPKIVLFMGACIKSPDLFIVTEFMANGSIRELLDKNKVKIEPEHIRRFSIDTCLGMTYLHRCKIIHRDLKTHNLLVDEHWNVKVADFGLSRAMGDTEGTMTACGTPSWAAPEVLRRDHYSFKADVYSFGICLWEMNTRKRPYNTLKPYQVVISVATNGLRPEIDTDVIPPYYEKLMKMCWSDNTDQRPDFPKLKELLEEIECPTPKRTVPSYRKESTMMDVLDQSHSLKDVKSKSIFQQ